MKRVFSQLPPTCGPPNSSPHLPPGPPAKGSATRAEVKTKPSDPSKNCEVSATRKFNCKGCATRHLSRVGLETTAKRMCALPRICRAVAPCDKDVLWCCFQEITMKALVAGLSVVSVALIVAVAVCAHSRADGNPKFQIDIQAGAQGGPKFTVMNLSGKAVSACVLEISIASEGKGQSRIVWDAALHGERPLEKGASISENLFHVVGAPLPDKVEVIAGMWSEGEPFGQSDWVKVILANHAARVSSYEQEISFLQRGLDQNWTREQFLAGLSSMPNPGIFSAIR